MGHAIYYFAVADDLLPVIETVERAVNVRYTLAGLHPELQAKQFDSAASLPDLGMAQAPDMNHVARYIVLPASCEVVVRAVSQRHGGTLYAIDQAMNEESVEFTPGGIFGSVAVISGRVATASSAEASLRIFRLYVRAIKKTFTRHGTYWVGRGAEQLARSGIRLTAAVKSPVAYDLALGP
jgi:hypothetical protein